MAAVGGLDDRFARVAITVLRHTGLRIGELLDLELENLVDYGANGTWLRVPLGKLNNERSVPVDDAALEALMNDSLTAPASGPVPTHATGIWPTSSLWSGAGGSAPPESNEAFTTP